jgi:hypothetical protein
MDETAVPGRELLEGDDVMIDEATCATSLLLNVYLVSCKHTSTEDNRG